MRRCLATVALVVALPGVGLAQKGPDRMLPGGSQVYMRWDGFEKHKKAYEKTALAKTMRGDLGKFLYGVMDRAGEQINNLLAGQIDPEVAASLRDGCAGLAESVNKNGFALGVEVRKVSPPQVDAVAVLPGGGRAEKSALSLLRAVAALAQKPVAQVKVGNRTVNHLDGGEVHFVWWAEGQDAVLALSTDGPEALLERLGGKGLADAPLYKQVTKSAAENWARGYIDFASFARVVEGHSKDAAKLVDELGLSGLKSLTFTSAFDGPAELGVVELDIAGPRKGLLKLLSKKTFTLDDLPPMPEDVSSFSASSAEVAHLYPVMKQAVEATVRLVAPDQLEQVQDAWQQFEKGVGVDVGKDLFGSLDNLAVQYSAWAEGPLWLGQTYLIKVKDADRLEKALDGLIDGLGKLPGANLTVKKSEYRGVTVRQIRLTGEFTIDLPAYAIHKGWLVVSNYPQPIQGYILRANGDLPRWKAGGDVQKALAPFPKEFLGVAVSDPRPAMKAVLSLLPAAATAANQALQHFGQPPVLDVGAIPNAYEATRHLFPNVTVTTEENGKVRSVTRTSLPLPF